MKRDDILHGIRHVFQKYLEIESGIDPNTDILHDLQLDSMAMLTLVVELENYFQIELEEGDEQNVRTIDDLIDLIAHRLGNRENDTHE